MLMWCSDPASKTALQIAWDRHVAKFSEADRKRFSLLGRGEIVDYVTAIEQALVKQKKGSKAFKVAEWFEPFADFVSWRLPILSSAVSAANAVHSSPAPLVLDGIAQILKLSTDFTGYQRSLVKALADMSEKVQDILRYNEQIWHDVQVKSALIEIYSDVLEFCRKAMELLVRPDGRPISGGSNTFKLSVFHPFQSVFGEDIASFDRHTAKLKRKADFFQQKIQQSAFALASRTHQDQQDISAQVSLLMARFEESSLVSRRQIDQSDVEKRGTFT